MGHCISQEMLYNKICYYEYIVYATVRLSNEVASESVRLSVHMAAQVVIVVGGQGAR